MHNSLYLRFSVTGKLVGSFFILNLGLSITKDSLSASNLISVGFLFEYHNNSVNCLLTADTCFNNMSLGQKYFLTVTNLSYLPSREPTPL